jgi:hypothetical protein
MADAADVERALVSTIAGALFTGGGYQPGAYAASGVTATPPATAQAPSPSAAALNVKLYRGWPEAANLDADMKAGNCHVSIYPERGMTRNVSRYFPVTAPLGPTVPPTITVTVSGGEVTLGGTITAGNVVGVSWGPSALQAAYAYAVQAGDGLASVAAALATLSGGTAVGNVLTLPSALNAKAATMAPQSVWTELRRQEQGFRVSVWGPFPDARDELAAAVDVALANLRNSAGALSRFMTLADGSAAKVLYGGSFSDDMPSRVRVWRRDLRYMVEFPTTLIQQQPLMLFGATVLQLVDDNVLLGTGALQPASEVQTNVNGEILVDAADNLIGVPPT